MPIPKLLTEMSELAGKTILAAKPDDPSRERVILYFMDGTAAAFTGDYGYDDPPGAILDTLCVWNFHEMLSLGVITQAEFDEWRAEDARERQASLAVYQERRRQEYERLKQEFEG